MVHCYLKHSGSQLPSCSLGWGFVLTRTILAPRPLNRWNEENVMITQHDKKTHKKARPVHEQKLELHARTDNKLLQVHL